MARVGVSWSYYQNKLKVVYILLSQVDPPKKKKKKQSTGNSFYNLLSF